MMACITLEAVNKLKTLYQEKYGEEINTNQALFIAGFKVKKGTQMKPQLKNYRIQAYPSKIANGLVFSGMVRNCVQSVDENGKIVYNTNPHPLHNLYQEVSVVTGDIIPKDCIDILEYGNEYKDGITFVKRNSI